MPARNSSSFPLKTVIDDPDNDTVLGVDQSAAANVRWAISSLREIMFQGIHVAMSGDTSLGPGLFTVPLTTTIYSPFFQTPTQPIYSVSSNELKPLIPGVYLCSFNVWMGSTGPSANDNVQSILEKNVDEIMRGPRKTNRGTELVGSHARCAIKMNGTTDVLRLRGLLTADGARTISGSGATGSHTYLNVVRLGS